MGHPINFKRKYKNLNDTLYWLVEQAKNSIPYALEYFPRFNNPEQVFQCLRLNTQYKNDPKHTELIQHLQTMMEGHYWGEPGRGDCDCFTAALLSVMWANDFPQTYIILVGNSKKAPSHIYAGCDWNGEIVVLDLTNPFYNTERTYKYKQILAA